MVIFKVRAAQLFVLAGIMYYVPVARVLVRGAVGILLKGSCM